MRHVYKIIKEREFNMFDTAKNYINKMLSEYAANEIGMDAIGNNIPSARETEVIKLLTRAIQSAYASNPGRTISFFRSIANGNSEVADILAQLNSNRSAMRSAFNRDRETVSPNPMDSGGETTSDIA